jgi:hypothetical protein
MAGMAEIEDMCARLAAAGSVPELLACAWDAFQLIAVIARQYEERSPDAWAAYAMTAAAAVRGRNLVTPAAAATPAGAPAAGLSTPAAGMPDPGDQLDELAAALNERLLGAAAALTSQAESRHACQQAAAEANVIRALLHTGD